MHPAPIYRRDWRRLRRLPNCDRRLLYLVGYLMSCLHTLGNVISLRLIGAPSTAGAQIIPLLFSAAGKWLTTKIHIGGRPAFASLIAAR